MKNLARLGPVQITHPTWTDSGYHLSPDGFELGRLIAIFAESVMEMESGRAERAKLGSGDKEI